MRTCAVLALLGGSACLQAGCSHPLAPRSHLGCSDAASPQGVQARRRCSELAPTAAGDSLVLARRRRAASRAWLVRGGALEDDGAALEQEQEQPQQQQSAAATAVRGGEQLLQEQQYEPKELDVAAAAGAKDAVVPAVEEAFLDESFAQQLAEQEQAAAAAEDRQSQQQLEEQLQEQQPMLHGGGSPEQQAAAAGPSEVMAAQWAASAPAAAATTAVTTHGHGHGHHARELTPEEAAADAEAYRKALLRTGLMLSSAVAFGLGTMAVKGRQSGLEFFAGYLVEQALSVDNLFVFIMLFQYFKVPQEYQGRVLTWGIIGAVTMRAAMIVLGVAAIQRFRGVILVFAGILLASSFKLLTEKEDEDGDLSNNFVLRVSRFFVKSTDQYDGENFFTRVDGKRLATPLLLCLVCIELSDFVFAVDSIPAVLGVSKDSFIVYTSNVFAILALRSLYTLVSHAITDLPYLKPCVALVLGFVGFKMCLEYFHIDIGIGVSLGVVATLLGGGVAASVWDNRRRAQAVTAAADDEQQQAAEAPLVAHQHI